MSELEIYGDILKHLMNRSYEIKKADNIEGINIRMKEITRVFKYIQKKQKEFIKNN